MSVKVRLKMKRRHFICEILAKQDFYLFQFKIAELVSQLPTNYRYTHREIYQSIFAFKQLKVAIQYNYRRFLQI